MKSIAHDIANQAAAVALIFPLLFSDPGNAELPVRLAIPFTDGGADSEVCRVFRAAGDGFVAGISSSE